MAEQVSAEIQNERAEKKRQQMLHSPIPKLILSMSLPTTMAQLITVIYSFADTLFVSHISTTATASVSIGFSLMSFIQAIGFGFAMGAGSMISFSLGKGDRDKANRVASGAAFYAVLAALIFMVFGLIFIRPFMYALGASDTSIDMACEYARYIIIGAPVMCLTFVMNVALRSEGHAFMAMTCTGTGGLLNIALDAIFVLALNMGVGGAALATLISQIVSATLLAIPFLLKRSIVRISPKLISTNIRDYYDMLRHGFPTIARQGIASLAMALLSNQGKVYGDAVVGALGITYKVYVFGRSLTIGIGQGFMPVAGYNFAQKQNKRVRQAFWFSTALATGICVALAAAMALFPEPIILLFQDDPELVSAGTACLRYLAIALPFIGYSTLANQLLQCLGYSIPATLLASCRQGIFFVPLILLLPIAFGLYGVEVTQAAADILTFIVTVPIQIIFFKKILPLKKEEEAKTE